MLSAVVLTKNEEQRITACLESIKWADEIIIVDGGSTDSTLQIVKKYTNNILTFSQEDFAARRNKAMEYAKGDWVLYVDSDERVLASLREEIEGLMKNGEFASYAISRKNIIFGNQVSYGPYKNDWVIRLFRKENFGEWFGKVHESANFKGKLGYAENSLLHLTHRDVDHFILKSLEWSKIDARLRLDSNHPKMTGWRFIRILITEIFNQGILRKGFFNGTVGIIDSILQVFSMFITYVRLWQLQQSKPLGKIYDELDEKLIENNFKY